MNKGTANVLHDMMLNGRIDRSETPAAWEAYSDTEVQEELEQLGAEVGFDIFRSGDRVYLVPSDDNDFFVKSNYDYRRDMKTDSDFRARDNYLLNYLAMYMIYIFFKGDNTDIKREFITKKDLIIGFNEHCESCIKANENGDGTDDYSDTFIQLANNWLAKTDGEETSQKITDKYGCINKLMLRFKKDDLFDDNISGEIRASRKLRDLIPYFLRKSRIARIHQWFGNIGKEKQNAHD